VDGWFFVVVISGWPLGAEREKRRALIKSTENARGENIGPTTVYFCERVWYINGI